MRFLTRLRKWFSCCDSPEPCRNRRSHREHVRQVERLNRLWEAGR